MPKAYSYVRMSTDIQLKGDSLRRQTQMSEEYAQQHGLELVRNFTLTDIGVSAFKGDNVTTGRLGQFMEMVRAGEIEQGSYLLVESLDRLSRQSIGPSLRLLLELNGSGMNVVTLQDGQLYRAGEAELTTLMMSIVYMSRAYEESQTKSRRLGAAWKNKRDNVDAKKLTSICPAWLKLSADRQSFSVIEERGRVIETIFGWANRGLGSFLLTKQLNESKTPPFGRSAGWVQSYVTKILQNRAVLGEYQPHILVDGKRIPTGDPIPNYFPAIIDEETFYAVQQGRRNRFSGAAGRKGPTHRNLFTNVAKCGYCGAPMHIVNKGTGPKGGVSLKCSLSRRKMCSGTKGWKYDNFERSFLFFAREIDFSEILGAASRKTTAREYEVKKLALTEKLRLTELKRDRTYALIEDENQDFQYLSGKLTPLNAEIKALKSELSKLKKASGELQKSESDPDQIVEAIDRLQTLEGAEAFQHRVQISSQLRSLVQELKVYPEGDGPNRKRLEKLLIEQEVSEVDRVALMAARDAASALAHSENPSFLATFADGVQRMVRVDKSDPLKYVAEVAIKDRKVTYDDTFWADGLSSHDPDTRQDRLQWDSASD